MDSCCSHTYCVCAQVQCVQWHPYDAQLLATGAYDGKVRLFDCMASKVGGALRLCCHGNATGCSNTQNKIRVWKLDGEVEKLLWNHLKPDHLLVLYMPAIYTNQLLCVVM